MSKPLVAVFTNIPYKHGVGHCKIEPYNSSSDFASMLMLEGLEFCVEANPPSVQHEMNAGRIPKENTYLVYCPKGMQFTQDGDFKYAT